MIERARSRGEIAQSLLLSETEEMRRIVADIKHELFHILTPLVLPILID